ncbi:MAG: hypothetical protein P4L86_22670 [Mycobacterium sp.]|nr:hypothetical protein [Mycobacterium sp.]
MTTKWMIPIASAVIVLAAAPGCASAQPPAFPDLGPLADVTQSYLETGPRNSGTIALFSTPDGLHCGLTSTSAQCQGPLPGVQNVPISPSGSSQGDCDLGGAQASDSGGGINHYKGPCPAAPGVKLLDVGQKITQGTTACGVLAGGVTACTTGPHGFVLQPSGSTTF